MNTPRIRRRHLRTLAAVVVAAVLLAGCALTAPRFGGYRLPPGEAQYTLTLDQANTHTTWVFTSSQVTEDETPEGYPCAEQIHAMWMDEAVPPCRAEPLIFLRYDADLGLDNSAFAGRLGTITVTTYRQADTSPRIAGLRLWISTDDGQTWERVDVNVTGQEREVFTGRVHYPQLSGTTRAVSVKVVAWDVEANRVDHRIDRAWFLKAPGQ